MALDIKKCLEEYEGARHVYEKLNKYLQHFLGELCSDNQISIHAITGRVKEKDSLADKLNRADRGYQDLTDINDICGIRVITYFQTDVDKVGDLIEREFETDKRSSVDKRDYKDPDRFGYASLHVVAKLSSERLRLPEYKAFGGHCFEIQVRSIIQHAWAEIEHNLGYKSQVSIPNPVKRRFFRLAALLEVADQEFSGIADQVSSYKQSLTSEIEKGTINAVQNEKAILLDVESLKIFLASSPLIKEIDSKIVLGTPHKLTDDLKRAGGAVDRLKYLGINDLASLTQALIRLKSFVEIWGNNWLRNVPTEQEFSCGVAIHYLCYCLVCESGDVEAIERYLVFAHIGGEKRNELVKKISKEYESLKSKRNEF